MLRLIQKLNDVKVYSLDEVTEKLSITAVSSASEVCHIMGGKMTNDDQFNNNNYSLEDPLKSVKVAYNDSLRVFYALF